MYKNIFGSESINPLYIAAFINDYSNGTEVTLMFIDFGSLWSGFLLQNSYNKVDK